MTSSVLPPFSSKVTVVTGPPSPPSSLVQTRRECGVTSMYLPKNSSGFDASWPNTKRYLPPTRTSISQERRNMPIDFGTHHCLNSSRLVCASELLENAAAGGVREGGERGVEAGSRILNHVVQYSSASIGGMQGEAERRCLPAALT